MQPSDATVYPTSGFHIGFDLDPDIRMYYQRLRRDIPTKDGATSQILDVVEHHMLQVDPEKRFTAYELRYRHVEIMQEAEQARRILSLTSVCNRTRSGQADIDISFASRGLKSGALDGELGSLIFARNVTVEDAPICSRDGGFEYNLHINQYSFAALDCCWGICKQPRSEKRRLGGHYISSRVHTFLENATSLALRLDLRIWIDALCIMQEERDVCVHASQEMSVTSHHLWLDGCSDGYTLNQFEKSPVYSSGHTTGESLHWEPTEPTKAAGTRLHHGSGTLAQGLHNSGEDTGCMKAEAVELCTFDTILIKNMVTLALRGRCDSNPDGNKTL